MSTSIACFWAQATGAVARGTAARGFRPGNALELGAEAASNQLNAARAAATLTERVLRASATGADRRFKILIRGSDPLLNIDPFGLELYIPESTADCWVNFLYDNRNNPTKTGRWVERETAPYTESLFAIPVVLPSVPLDPTDRRTRLEPASVGAVVIYAQYRDTWRHQMLERRVSYEYICQDPCTGEIDEEFGQASDEIVGPREQFVRKRLIGVDYEFMPSQLPISPPSPRRIPQ